MDHIKKSYKIKIYIKIYIKTAPTCFGLRPSSGSLHMRPAKVTFIKSVKLCRYGLWGCVAACYIKSMVVCVLCAVQSETLHSTQITKTRRSCFNINFNVSFNVF